MPRVVVTDASCLIDLRKGQLLQSLSLLPYRFVIPLPIREFELLDFTTKEWAILDGSGMETYELPPEKVKNVLALKRQYGNLSVNDCFCLVTAQYHDEGILLTGDGLLRSVATETGVRVHGVLWVTDKLKNANNCDNRVLLRALNAWKADATVFLPELEINQRLRRF